MPITDLEAAMLLAARFGRNPGAAPPDAWTVALAFTAPDNAGQGALQPVGSGYQPVDVPNDGDHWENVGDGRSVANSQPITFPAATQDGWGTCGFYLLRDPDGNVRAWGAIDPPLQVAAGDQPSFAAGTLVISSPVAP